MSENTQVRNEVTTIDTLNIIGMTPPQFVAHLHGVNSRAIQPWLVADGALRPMIRGYKVVHPERYFSQRMTPQHNGPGRPYAVLNLGGARWLYEQYQAGKLPMKSDWDGEYTQLVITEPAA